VTDKDVPQDSNQQYTGVSTLSAGQQRLLLWSNAAMIVCATAALAGMGASRADLPGYFFMLAVWTGIPLLMSIAAYISGGKRQSFAAACVLVGSHTALFLMYAMEPPQNPLALVFMPIAGLFFSGIVAAVVAAGLVLRLGRQWIDQD